MSASNGQVFRDARIDKAVSWSLVSAAALALSLGAWFFQRLDTRIEVLTSVLAEVTRGAAVREARLTVVEREVDRLRAKVDSP